MLGNCPNSSAVFCVQEVLLLSVHVFCEFGAVSFEKGGQSRSLYLRPNKSVFVCFPRDFSGGNSARVYTVCFAVHRATGKTLRTNLAPRGGAQALRQPPRGQRHCPRSLLTSSSPTATTAVTTSTTTTATTSTTTTTNIYHIIWMEWSGNMKRGAPPLQNEYKYAGVWRGSVLSEWFVDPNPMWTQQNRVPH